MATPSISIPANIENYTIISSLNSSMLLNFLMGIYTMVYGGTIYVYLFNKPSNTSRRVVLPTISVLYMLAFLNSILQWYFLDWSLVNHGDTRESMFWASLEYPFWFNAMLEFIQDFSLVLSDGLLIWRCYHVWGKSIQVIAFPSFLLFSELALSVTDTVMDALIPEFTSAANTALTNNIVTAFTCVSLGTTASATFLIGYKIHTASGNVWRSRRRYSRIVATIVESSAVYSLVLFVFAMTLVIPPFYDVESPLWEVSFYIGVTLNIVSGLAPTVMVLRLALTSPTNMVSSSTIIHISCIDFNNSQQGSDGSGSHASATGRQVTSAAHVEGNGQDHQTPVIDLTKESTTRNWIEESPV